MDYRANIHQDTTVSLTADRYGQRITVSIPWNPVTQSVALTKDQYDSMLAQTQTQNITYIDNQFVYTPKAMVS